MRFLIILIIFLFSNCEAATSIENFLTEIEIQHFHSGMSNVDCVYVINLEFRREKWQATSSALNKYGINCNRVNAINGWLLSEEEKQILAGHYPTRLSGGRVGCILSHISAIKDANKRNFDVVWICEDDIKICGNPHDLSNLITTLTKIDPEWDILYTDPDSKNSQGQTIYSLASDFRPDFPHESLSYYTYREVVNEDILLIRQRFGTYSMLVSNRGIEKILDYFTNMYLWAAYDIELHYIPGIKQYCLTKDLVSINYTEPSDIQ